MLEDATICSVLHTLYAIARMHKGTTEMELIKTAYIKAKKMNRKLYEYRYGELHDLPNNSWKEEDWEKEIESGIGLVFSEEAINILIKESNK